MSGIFNSDIFNNSIFNVGETAGIGLVPKPVDFVYADGWHTNVPRIRLVRKHSETDDLKEMMSMYSSWRMAA